jgi:hypothetical protein
MSKTFKPFKFKYFHCNQPSFHYPPGGKGSGAVNKTFKCLCEELCEPLCFNEL